MNILDMLKFGKLALQDEAQLKRLIAAAKQMEGPKPSWKTGEFWINQVIPTIAAIVGGGAAVFSAPALVPWFVIATVVLSAVGYLGRTMLKMKHIDVTAMLDPELIGNVTKVVSAVKDAANGNVDAAKGLTETLNTSGTTVNVNTPAA